MLWSQQFEHFVSTAIGALGPFAAVLLGGGLTLIGVVLAQRGEGHRARSQHEWALRAATADRLRELYAPYVALSIAMNDFAQGWQISVGETNADRQSRMRDDVLSAWDDTVKVNARVELEPGSSGVKNAARELRTKFKIFDYTLQNIAQLEGIQWSEHMVNATEELQSACDSMVEQAVAHIAELEAPR